ncbi:hypothetical protein CcaverHIS002_0102640 [Cutaneotrichosporon cavernicola]|uniref:Uncharacterized protein n=1 Tax=Cutaneotrichosporon cavernicola TaxID=279322 RepID=A0AA48I5Q9_9TREE|nr:uncharacterized protein CcaverHIS019_0102580 [Cutaneotrichosporon cavernicola]BEI79735.1 hypothetical protein CcaverHIS002_0102640 [Cutaneotrichosporon cavernicola]BEI87540.1 hypothetical protein CcaverHIS019_0102580 [Cutaneotrichosporon cavernicola]BEI95312.1 hypothetical protein CcaverHIS631_0102610 [Cutaneotrichosporon cavernicola]BEJ03085.1 hypothetical protein CcaverHIS641_0102600 [Cutaneotrichosporon cavernicola]
MHGNRFSLLTENANSSKQTTTSKQTPTTKPAAIQPDDKVSGGGPSGNHGRGRGRGRGGAGGASRFVGEKVVLQAEGAKQPQQADWGKAFRQMEAQHVKEMTDPNPASGWDETPKDKYKRLLVERWRVNVVPGAPYL